MWYAPVIKRTSIISSVPWLYSRVRTRSIALPIFKSTYADFLTDFWGGSSGDGDDEETEREGDKAVLANDLGGEG